MFNIRVGYPTEAEELEIMKLTTSPFDTKLSPILSGPDIMQLQDVVRRVPIADHVIRYAMKLARATRIHAKEPVPDFIRQWVSWAAGPRASQYLIIGAKAAGGAERTLLRVFRRHPRGGASGAPASRALQFRRGGRGSHERRGSSTS